jgi:dihydroorotate dehydrogenase subfamily 2
VSIKPQNLSQTVHGITFESPIGLAAGFDYEARLTQILPALGFGFETVGTITYSAYEGNAPPMLGRLPKSRSLMVNKGFKNLGAQATLRRLSQLTFSIPVGISIGRTNSLSLKTQTESVEDIINTFTVFETSPLKHSYYELNISCPNLYGDISFYPPKNLEQLLKHVDELKIKRPLFIKMPIEKTNKEIMSMLDVIVKYHIAGVIFGNLQKNRQDPSLNPDEVAKFDKGAFSGKPTFNRSNELISLAYQYFGEKLTIIGCGGVFSTEDAYKKIKLGASLVQLITGMIYRGPTLISQINDELSYLLESDGFKTLSSARGIEAKKTKF